MSLEPPICSGLYYWSMVSREDFEKARALLELFISSGRNFSLSDVMC